MKQRLGGLAKRNHGRVQRHVRGLLIEHNGEAVPFSALALRCFGVPNPRDGDRWSIYESLWRYAVNVRRGWWAPNAELMARIRGD
jgi:hypothetical protein